MIAGWEADMQVTTAAFMARSVGIDPKTFRAALRRQHFSWHPHDSDWTVEIGSDHHRQMIAVLKTTFANAIARD
jgi:hypothetical protein